MSIDGAWRSLVARLLREQEVGGSNPLAPILFRDVAWVWHDELSV